MCPSMPALAPRYVSIIGTVGKQSRQRGKEEARSAVKTDKGEAPVVKFDDKTQFLGSSAARDRHEESSDIARQPRM